MIYVPLQWENENYVKNKSAESNWRTASALISRGGKNRTRVNGFGDRCSTIEPRPCIYQRFIV